VSDRWNFVSFAFFVTYPFPVLVLALSFFQKGRGFVFRVRVGVLGTRRMSVERIQR